MRITVPVPWEASSPSEPIDDYVNRINDVTTSRALGRLVAILARKGLLTAPEVTHVVERYWPNNATFSE